MHRGLHQSSLGEQFRVVELTLLRDNVRVCARRRDEVVMTDELADTRPWHPAQMQERDAAVAQIVR